MKAKELLRWAMIVAFSSLGLYALPAHLRAIHHGYVERDWLWVIFSLWFGMLVTGIPLAISYLVFRRAYRRLTSIAAFLAALVLWSALMSLQRHFKVDEFFYSQVTVRTWFLFIALPVTLLGLFGPIYAAAWFYRRCMRLADRYLFVLGAAVPFPTPPAT